MKTKNVYLFLFLCMPSIVNTKLVNIKNIKEYEQLINQEKPVLVKFAANWCSVCQGVKEPFKNIAQEKEFDNIICAQIDIDALKDLSKQHNIAGVPTFVYMQNGKQLSQDVGVQNMVTFEDDLRSNIRNTFNLAQNNIHEIEKSDSTQGHIEKNKKASKALEVNTDNTEKQTSPGVIESITSYFTQIIELIKNAIKYVMDKIIGIFR